MVSRDPSRFADRGQAGDILRGPEAPGITLHNQDGEAASLSGHTGGSSSTFPRTATPDEKHGIDVWGISNDPVDGLGVFATKHDLPMQLLADEDVTEASAYESYGTTNVFDSEVEGRIPKHASRPRGPHQAGLRRRQPREPRQDLLADIDGRLQQSATDSASAGVVFARTYRVGSRSTAKHWMLTTSRPSATVARSTGPVDVIATYGGAGTGLARSS